MDLLIPRWLGLLQLHFAIPGDTTLNIARSLVYSLTLSKPEAGMANEQGDDGKKYESDQQSLRQSVDLRKKKTKEKAQSRVRMNGHQTYTPSNPM